MLYRKARQFENGRPNFPDEICVEFFEELRFAKNEEKITGNFLCNCTILIIGILNHSIPVTRADLRNHFWIIN